MVGRQRRRPPARHHLEDQGAAGQEAGQGVGPRRTGGVEHRLTGLGFGVGDEAAPGQGRAGGDDVGHPCSDPELDPGAGVHPVVHGVVDEAGVAADGDAAAGGAQIGLRRDGVLLVAQLVADVGEQLDQGGADVGRVALVPVRLEEGEAVEEHPAERPVVLGQPVDGRMLEHRRRARIGLGAVQLALAHHPEGERHAGQHGVDAGQGALGLAGRHQPQPVVREVARLGQPHPNRPGIVGRRHLGDRDAPGRLAAGDDDLGRGGQGGDRLQEPDQQLGGQLRQRPRRHHQLHVLDPVQAGAGPHRGQPLVGAAAVDGAGRRPGAHAAPAGARKRSTKASWVRRSVKATRTASTPSSL